MTKVIKALLLLLVLVILWNGVAGILSKHKVNQVDHTDGEKPLYMVTTVLSFKGTITSTSMNKLTKLLINIKILMSPYLLLCDMDKTFPQMNRWSGAQKFPQQMYSSHLPNAYGLAFKWREHCTLNKGWLFYIGVLIQNGFIETHKKNENMMPSHQG